MIGISAGAVSRHLSQNRCPARFGKVQVFQNQDGCAFADYKAIPLGIERPGGFFGRIIALGKSFAGT